MKTLNLRVDDALYEHLLALLKQLPQDRIQVEETPPSEANASPMADDDAKNLMRLAGQVSAFAVIDDPVAWQKQQREEWEMNKP